MDTPIPLKGVVLFIAFGTMIFIIVFCFVKRQITRFQLRSSHSPHSTIGLGAPKHLQNEIARRLKRVKEIIHEPKLLDHELEDKLATQAATDSLHFIYRMKAVDGLSLLDAELLKCNPSVIRPHSTQLRAFLMSQRLNGGPLEGCRFDLLDKFCSSYDHARHDPKNFSQADYQQFMDLLSHIIAHLKSKTAAAAVQRYAYCQQSTSVLNSSDQLLKPLDAID